jgi:hypothetical protein
MREIASLEFFRHHFEIPGKVQWGILEIKRGDEKHGETDYCICVIPVDHPTLCIDVEKGIFTGSQDYKNVLEVNIHPAKKIEQDGYFEIVSEEKICHGEQYTIEAREQDFATWYRYKIFSPELEKINPLP